MIAIAQQSDNDSTITIKPSVIALKSKFPMLWYRWLGNMKAILPVKKTCSNYLNNSILRYTARPEVISKKNAHVSLSLKPKKYPMLLHNLDHSQKFLQCSYTHLLQIYLISYCKLFANSNYEYKLFIAVMLQHIFTECVTKWEMFIQCCCKHFIAFKYHGIPPFEKSWKSHPCFITTNTQNADKRIKAGLIYAKTTLRSKPNANKCQIRFMLVTWYNKYHLSTHRHTHCSTARFDFVRNYPSEPAPER